MDKRLIIAIVIILLIIIAIYLFLGSATPENLTKANVVNSNVSGILI
jgi:hypothetical protein